MHAVAVRDGQIVAEAGDPRLLDLPPLVGEADPGAPARARAPRPRRPRDRDRVLRHTSPGPSSSRPSGRSSRPHPPPRPISRPARSRPRSSTTAPGKHAGFLVRLSRARLRDAGVPAGLSPAPGGAARRGRGRRRGRAGVDAVSRSTAAACRPSRLPLDRCAHAFARLPAPRRWAARRRGDASPSGDAPRADRRRRDARPGARRLGREGRCRGALLCLLSRRSRRRAEGRGRSLPGDSPCTCALSAPARVSRPERSVSSRWRTATARPSGELRTRPESRGTKG